MRVNEEYDKNKLKLKNRPIIFTHTHVTMSRWGKWTQCAVKTNKTYINLTSLSFRHHAGTPVSCDFCQPSLTQYYVRSSCKPGIDCLTPIRNKKNLPCLQRHIAKRTQTRVTPSHDQQMSFILPTFDLIMTNGCPGTSFRTFSSVVENHFKVVASSTPVGGPPAGPCRKYQMILIPDSPYKTYESI